MEVEVPTQAGCAHSGDGIAAPAVPGRTPQCSRASFRYEPPAHVLPFQLPHLSFLPGMSS